jgi:hypothetical protein
MKNIENKVNNFCPECGQDHSAVTIRLEHGGFITAPVNIIKSERRPKRKQSHILTPDIFWPEEEEEGLG